MTRLISTLDVTVVNTPVPALRVAATLTPPAFPPGPARLDPTHVTETTCRRLLARSWTSWSRTLSRLGVTDLDRYERRLLDAPGFLDGCAALTDAARACLRAAPDVLAAVGRCDAYGLSLPDLFEDEDAHAMDAVLGVNAPTLAQLAGTWVSVTDPHDRWTIDASGRASDGSSRMKLTIVSDGALDVGGYPAGFVLDGPDDLYLAQGDRAFPLRDEQHVVAVTNVWDDDDWLVLDPRGCVTIGDDGQLSEAICQFVDRGGARWFDAGSASYLELAGHLVPPDVAAAHYHRAP